MPNFVAIDENGFAKKSFIADSFEEAEAAAGMRCVVSPAAPIGHKWDEEAGEFRPLSPFASWVWNAEIVEWEAPEAKPEGDVIWDEEQLAWAERVIEIVEPAPEEASIA